MSSNPGSREPKPRCEILETLYVKASGKVPCNCDFGERKILGRLTRHSGVMDLFAGENYRAIRDHVAAGSLPWPDICRGCSFLKADPEHEDLLARRIIRKLQFEPSLRCNLACPLCANATQMRLKFPPYHMDVARFDTFTAELRDNGYTIRTLEYCGQGEPLMHPDMAGIIETARRNAPDAHQRVITNGNFNFRRSFGDHLPDEIVVSCDGATQDSYVQYRKKGNFDRVLRFMADGAETFGDGPRKLVWKYILFEFNDSDEELIRAQELARQHGIRSLLFVFTRTQFKSRRFTPQNAADLPIIQPGVSSNAHPALQRQSLVTRPLSKTDPERADIKLNVDSIQVFRRQWVTIRGWAVARRGIGTVKFWLNDQYLGEIPPSIHRPDVRAAHPGFQTENAGFAISGRLENTDYDTLALRAEIHGEDGPPAHFTREYASPAPAG